jgi:hypothetical protein
MRPASPHSRRDDESQMICAQGGRTLGYASDRTLIAPIAFAIVSVSGPPDDQVAGARNCGRGRVTSHALYC